MKQILFFHVTSTFSGYGVVKGSKYFFDEAEKIKEI